MKHAIPKRTLELLFFLFGATSSGVWAQQGVEEQIRKYQEALPTERVYVHLSETIVGAGESIWFQAIISDPDSTVTLSEVLYVELSNQQSSVVQGIYKTSTNSNLVSGQLVLPDTLSSGWYQLQAYTRYMRNGPASNFFSQPVLVVNATHTSSANVVSTAGKNAEMAFFPEGGRLVEGVENRLVVQMNPAMVSQESVLEIIQAVDSSTITAVSLVQGVGMFSLIPEADTQYLARLSSSEDTVLTSLPEANPTGYTLGVEVTGEALRVNVSGREAAKGLQLVVRTEQQLVYNQRYPSTSFSTLVPFSSTGLLEVALLDDQGDELAQRLVYVPASVTTVPIELSRSKFAPREALTFSLSGNKLPQETVLSVAVRKVPLLSGRQLSLSALEKYGLDGLSLSETLGANQDQVSDWVNQWLVTQVAPWPAWSSVLFKPAPAQYYAKEDEFLLVTGKVNIQQPFGEEDQVLLSIPGDDPYFEYSEIAWDGSFAIPISRVNGVRSVVLQYDSPTNDSLPREMQWDLEDPFATVVPPSLPPAFVLSEEDWQSLIDGYRLRKRIETAYLDPPSDAEGTKKAVPKEFRFYGAPNVRVNPEDYIALPSFEEICRELLPGIRLTEKRGVYDFDVFDPGTRDFLPNEPTLFIDGVPVRDVSFIVNFPPNQIERIETVNRRTYYGSVRLDGVIAVYTKEGNAYEQALSTTMQEADLQFYAPSQAFAAPDSLPAHLPDFRTLLHWQPKVTVSPSAPTTLSCTTADELGEFEIVAQGWTKKGEPVYGRTTFEVTTPDVP
ncbi:MAG: hypothetical protein RIG62_04000 [Cyclobacteriaceae bacterium]